jgi:hypothetical protein
MHRSSRRGLLVFATVVLVAGIAGSGAGAAAVQQVPADTWANAANRFGPLRRSSHRKLAPTLSGYDTGQGTGASIGPDPLSPVHADSSGRVRVDVDGPDTGALQAAIDDAGGSAYSIAPGAIRADVPATSLGKLADDPRVERVREPQLEQPALLSQGVGQTGASTWQANGRTGQNTKVAVVDLGFTGLATEQTAGRLPATVNRSFCGAGDPASLDGDTNHGTAVAEIVHQMAPDAPLYLVCFDQDEDLAGVVSYLSSQGVTIVNASWGSPIGGRGDGVVGPGNGGTDTVSSAIATGRAAGQLWAVASGNEGGQHYGFLDLDRDADGAVEFFGGNPVPGPDPTETYNFSVPTNQVADISLKWDQWPITSQEFQLCVWVDSVSQANFVGCASDGQSTNPGPPTTAAALNQSDFPGHNNFVLAIINASNVTTVSRMDLYFDGAVSAVAASNGGSVSDPAWSPSALAVGAYDVNGQNPIEPYSSTGPTIDGRLKPDISGPDDVENDVFNPFRGTSAAAPHVTGAAALVKGASPAMTPDGLQSFLTCRALDGGAAGPDNQFGFGRLNLGGLNLTLPPNASKPALVRGTTVFERNDQCSGPAQSSLVYGNPGDTILMCDWDGNGTKTPGAFRNGFWMLRNAPGNGFQDVPTFQLGDPGDIPVCGHWSNQTPGTAETPGVFRHGVFYLKFQNTTGIANTFFAYGNTTDVPVTGDWNGDGIATVGVYRSGTWFLRNANGGGFSDLPPVGYGDAGDVPVVGDWNGDGTTTMGVFRNGLWLLRNDNVGGFSTVPTFLFGSAGDLPRAWR